MQQFEGMVNDRFADYGAVLGVDLFAVHIHFLLIELGKVEEMTGLGLVVPCLACMSLIQKQGLLALSNALVFMVLNFPEEIGKDLGVAPGPACWGGPCINARAIGCSCPEGEAVIAGFGDVPEVFIGGPILVGRLETMLDEVPQGHVLKFAKLVDLVWRELVEVVAWWRSWC